MSRLTGKNFSELTLVQYVCFQSYGCSLSYSCNHLLLLLLLFLLFTYFVDNRHGQIELIIKSGS